MKRFTLLAGALMLFAASAMAQDKEPTQILLVPEADAGKTVSYSLDAMSVIQAKCLGCHSPSGKSDKAKERFEARLARWTNLCFGLLEGPQNGDIG